MARRYKDWLARDGFYDYLRGLVEEAKTQHGLVRSAEGWQWTQRCESTAKAERQPQEANDDQRF